MKKLVILRRASQVLFLSLFVYILWSTTYPLKGAFSTTVIFRLDPLIMFLTALSERVLVPGLIFAGAMLLLTMFLGRFFCGWICPLGTVGDAFGSLKRKKAFLPDDTANRKLRQGKFIVLGAMLVFALAGVQVAWVFDPIVISGRVVSLNFIPTLTMAVDQAMVFLIQRFELYGGFYDLYRGLKSTLLGVEVRFFANALVTFGFFAVICGAGLFLSRAWCRTLCPLGALYALFAHPARLQRRTQDCNLCLLCSRRCRMGAIRGDSTYDQGECILCMDCVYDCPQGGTRFAFSREPRKQQNDDPGKKPGMTRGQFLFLLAGCLPLLGFKKNGGAVKSVIRPPGALPERQFVNTCVRCGNCMKVCITNGLQPVMLESGVNGIWTPQLVPEIGYCEHNCTLCGSVCPTGAIPKLSVEAKRETSLGLAVIDHSTCYAWAQDKECIVCEEHCPVADKAIKVKDKIINGTRIYLPYVDPEKCIGCGICQNKCPVRPVRAIRVQGRGVALNSR